MALLAVTSRTSERRGASSSYVGLILAWYMVSLELVLAAASCASSGLCLQTAAEDGHSLRLVCSHLNPHEGVGIASSAHREGPDSRDECFQMLTL